jgi:hypothetical protein
MDELVTAAMQKWPNVPACYGWLALDGRGDWYLRDEQAQRAGSFQQQSAWPMAKGSRLQHEGLVAFIARNYLSEANGCYFFQNGPQRVYVELETTPWVWRLDKDGHVTAQTGYLANAKEAWLDEQGMLFLLTDVGFGRVHNNDMYFAAELLQSHRWPVNEGLARDFEVQFKYVLSPQSLNAQQKAR